MRQQLTVEIQVKAQVIIRVGQVNDCILSKASSETVFAENDHRRESMHGRL